MGCRNRLGRLRTSCAILIVLVSQPVHAQGQLAPLAPADAGSLAASSLAASLSNSASPAPPPPPRAQRRPGASTSGDVGLPVPEFQAGANVNVSGSYVTNATGLPGASQMDYVSSLGASVYLHEHSRRASLDANYNGEADFYAKGTLPTQVNNNLQAVANWDIISDHLSLGAKAFAQPVLTSSLGVITADNRVVPNGFQDSYGYYVNPELRLSLGDFAVSETVPSFGQAFFTSPAGSSNFPLIPGIGGPEDTTSRSLTERISSGTDFDRFNWNLVGSLSETARSQSLLSEKAGAANLRYAVSYEFSLLATLGYDAISNSTLLNQNVTGPEALGGFGLTFGKDFSLQVEAGEKYNSPSFFGALHYNISPRTLLSASVDDTIQTPEGQLLDNLTNLAARPDGSLGTAQNVLGNGSPPSLSSFSIQSQGNLALDQNIARYQTATVSFAEDFERNHASASVFATRRTILSGVFFGPQKTDTWGMQLLFSHDFSHLLLGTIGGSYAMDNELGGHAQAFGTQAQMSYQLSRQTSIYLSAQSLHRSSSPSLLALSPLTGTVSDLRATIGISHAL
jgi:uncharacterized protein (PEP-CTERM system associated)